MSSMRAITLRISEGLHSKAVEAAQRSRRSLNSWIVGILLRELDGEPQRYHSTAERRPHEPEVPGSKPGAPTSAAALGFARDFLDGLEAIHPQFRPPHSLVNWSSAARLMLERDQRPLAEAQELARWLFESQSSEASFWRGNILSVPKFRQKYDQLMAQKQRSERRVHKPGPIEQMIQEYGDGGS